MTYEESKLQEIRVIFAKFKAILYVLREIYETQNGHSFYKETLMCPFTKYDNSVSHIFRLTHQRLP